GNRGQAANSLADNFNAGCRRDTHGRQECDDAEKLAQHEARTPFGWGEHDNKHRRTESGWPSGVISLAGMRSAIGRMPNNWPPNPFEGDTANHGRSLGNPCAASSL